jgi:major membrane immunogen (membrane-anchored lipoprotein)
MKSTIIVIACSLLLLGCSKQESQQSASSIGFRIGSSRDAITKQLDQMHARAIEDSPELVLAELKLQRSTRVVELTFTDGKLKSVNYHQ